MSDQQYDFSPPGFFLRFMKRFPGIADKYEALGHEVHDLGPLDGKTRALIKLAISGSSGMESAFRAHMRKARKAGVSQEEMEHVVFLFLPTKGFPCTMKALSQIEQEFEPK